MLDWGSPLPRLPRLATKRIHPDDPIDPSDWDKAILINDLGGPLSRPVAFLPAPVQPAGFLTGPAQEAKAAGAEIVQLKSAKRRIEKRPVPKGGADVVQLFGPARPKEEAAPARATGFDPI